MARTPARRRRSATGLTPYLFVAFVVLVCVVGFSAYNWWNPPSATALVGKAWVIDGDTVILSGTHIRLEGIDAPETGQTCLDAAEKSWNCGQAATRELRRYIRGRELTCEPRSKDRYHRVLAVCSLPDGSQINPWMVRQGWALSSGFVKTYASEETEAENAKRGLWAGSFEPPWEWRRQHPRLEDPRAD
ncbi:thermonuclease family protein [Bradyrhizobium sp. LHD-71]|uniref:thermonuclease family protein n=1 Tax=Bradyrhizobium sp. LHD-71 TaxID=3072141 RepID=UPI00280D1450|nr:thermonuclease family protein [Bradyrhizobium sp. LHD-71]MDQ8727989.1 thermonuclease family protein [Bradyrhizobium sp. LHD-71]